MTMDAAASRLSLAHRNHALDACFLGPYGENDSMLEKLVVEFLRDHVYWRRNFHPEDPPVISTHAAHHPDYLAFEAKLRRELHQLSAALKKSVPFHSPRYLGHMVSDLLIPGLAAQILTLPYNPNNVSEDAAPALEVRARQVHLDRNHCLGRYRHLLGGAPVLADAATPDAGHDPSAGSHQHRELVCQPVLDAWPLQPDRVDHPHTCGAEPGGGVACPLERSEGLRDDRPEQRQIHELGELRAIACGTRREQHGTGQLDRTDSHAGVDPGNDFE